MEITQKNQEEQGRDSILTQAVLWVCSIFFLIPNLLFAFQGFSSRYWADDYCFSGFVNKFGLIDGLATFYSTTSNRFSAFIFAGVSELFGSTAIRILPVLVILFSGILLFRLVKKILGLGRMAGSKNISFLFSQLLLFFILYLSPNIDQSVYWRSGLMHYFLPFPILIFLLTIIFFPKHDENIPIMKLLLVFLLAGFNAGLSESYAALQFGLFGLLLFFKLVFSKYEIRKREDLNIVLVLAGTAAAMGIMILSPGNSLRLDSLQQAPDLFSIILISISSAFNFIKFSIRGLWLPFSVLFGLSITAAYYFIGSLAIQFNGIRLARTFFLIALVVFGLILCICAPTAYGMMAYPEQRVLMLAHIVLVLGVFSEGVLIGIFLQKYFSSIPIFSTINLILFLLFCLYPLSTLPTRFTEMSIYARRASLWDKRNIDIQSKIDLGKTVLTVKALDSFSEIAELNQDGKFWVNQCAANFYGVDSISAVESK